MKSRLFACKVTDALSDGTFFTRIVGRVKESAKSGVCSLFRKSYHLFPIDKKRWSLIISVVRVFPIIQNTLRRSFTEGGIHGK